MIFQEYFKNSIYKFFQVSVSNWKVNMFWKELCQAKLHIKQNILNCKNQFKFKCLITTKSLLFEINQNNNDFIIVNNNDYQVSLEYKSEFKYIIDPPQHFLNCIVNSYIYVLYFVQYNLQTYIYSISIPLFNVLLENFSINVNYFELSDILYIEKKLNYCPIKIDINCINKLLTFNNDLNSDIKFTDIICKSNNIECFDFYLDSQLLKDENQIITHSFHCLSCFGNSNDFFSYFSNDKTLNTYISDNNENIQNKNVVIIV